MTAFERVGDFAGLAHSTPVGDDEQDAVAALAGNGQGALTVVAEILTPDGAQAPATLARYPVGQAGRGARDGLWRVGRVGRRVAFGVVAFRLRAHDFAAHGAARVGQHEGVRGDAPPSATAGAGDLDFQVAFRVGKITVIAVVTVITVIGGQRGLTAKSACAAWIFRFTVITVTIFKTIRVRNGREILRSLVMVMESCRVRRVYCSR
jgi:hypothetical protein